MVAILYSDGTSKDNTLTSNATEKTWISPADADSSNTVDVPTITGKTVLIKSCFDNTTGDSVTATVSGFTVTLDAAGGTTNHTYVLTYMYV